MSHFEQQYPITTRENEIKQILQYVTRGQSCQLISVPGAGRSTVLRLLAYHKKLREYHLASKGALQAPFQSYLFVYANFAELPSFETQELTKFLFLGILSAIRELHHPRSPSATSEVLLDDSSEVNLVALGKEIYAIFKEAVSVGDPQVLSRSLKRAIELFSHTNYSTIFLFDRFSEFGQKLPPEFFSNLRALRQTSGGKLSVVFSTHQPLEELLTTNDFYEYYAGNHVFLEMYDSVATNFRISVIEKEYNKKLNSKTKEELIKLTGGHGRLVKLGTQILLSERTHPRGVPHSLHHPAGVTRSDLVNFLLDNALIKSSLLEIWQAIPQQNRFAGSKQNGFVGLFPLYDEFVKRGLPKTLVPKAIRFDEVKNEIYFGDEPLSGLTAQEFKLLKFLVGNPNKTCGRDEVIAAVWTDTKTAAGVTDQALDQMVYRVRRKIEDEADNPKHLLTVKGRGFKFIP